MSIREKLLGKTLGKIEYNDKLSVISFSDGSGFSIHTTLSVHLDFEQLPLRVISVEMYEERLVVKFSERSYFSISRYPLSAFPEIFTFEDADGTLIIDN